MWHAISSEYGYLGAHTHDLSATQLDSLHAYLECLHGSSYGFRRCGQAYFHFFFEKWTAVQNQRYASGIRRLQL